MKIKFFKIKKNYNKEVFKINPNLYWKILLIFTALLIGVFFVFAYNLFNKINAEDSLISGEGNTKVGKEEGKIDEVLKYFEDREKKSIEILNSAPLVVDPSL